MPRLTRLFLGVVWMIFASLTPLQAQSPCAATAGQALGPSVGQWQRWEQTLISTQDYVGSDGRGNPYRDLLIRVTFTNCTNGTRFQTYGFWYGLEKNAASSLVDNRKAFRLRAALPAGTWQWETSCSKSPSAATSVPNCANSIETGLAKKGRFQVTAGGTNALYRQGFLDRSNDGRLLTYGRPSPGAEGIPFFWLGDAAWNAPILATQSAWQTYIDNRASNTSAARPNTAFTVVQVAIAPKLAGLIDTNGNPPFDHLDSTCTQDAKPPNKCSRWNARYWAGLDDKIQYANQKGLLILLAGLIEPLQKELDTDSYEAVGVFNSPGLVTLARNVASRYYGNFVVFSPGFDHMIVENLTVINSVGQTIGDDTISRNFVTNHPAGSSSLSNLRELQSKSWLDFQMFQSGTPGSTPLAELTNATDRARSLPLSLIAVGKPVINGEAIYDGTVGDNAVNHTPYRARQTAYLSFLSGATGYSAGTCGIFDWGKGLGGCPAHVPLSSAMTQLTSRSMRHLRYILQSVYWPRLRPEHGRIKNQDASPDKKMVLAYDGSSAIIAYLPASCK